MKLLCLLLLAVTNYDMLGPSYDMIGEQPVQQAAAVVVPRRAVLYRFTAAWCAPCRIAAQVAERLRARGVTVYDIDIDRFPEWASASRVQTIPHWQLDVDGRFGNAWTGQATEEFLESQLEAAKGQQ